MATNNSSVLSVKQRPGCIAIGWSGVICKLDEFEVVKHPKYFPGNTACNDQFRDLIERGRNILERLGDHEGIIKYLGVADSETGAIRLAYAKQGDLSTYIQTQEKPSEPFRKRWIESLTETFYFMYRRRVLHQDIKLSNILVDNNSLRVIDFANGALFPLDDDMEKICEDDPLSRVDLLSLGCVIYSITTWQVFTYDYFEENRWPTSEELPPTAGILGGDIIKRCWEDKYSTMASLREDVTGWMRQKR